jgi:hypothetical protein
MERPYFMEKEKPGSLRADALHFRLWWSSPVQVVDTLRRFLRGWVVAFRFPLAIRLVKADSVKVASVLM